MPRLRQPLFEVAWRHAGETGKIQYRVRKCDGSTRPLITREGMKTAPLLDDVLEPWQAEAARTDDES